MNPANPESSTRGRKEDFADLSELYVKKKLVQFMSLDEDQDFIIFRKFKKLSLYVLLERQDQLRKLEDLICDWECRDEKDRPPLLPALSDKMRNAHGLLKDYHEMLLRQRQIMKLPRPTDRLLEYLRVEAPRRMNEWEPIVMNHGSADMISLSDSEKGFIHEYIRKSPRLEKLFVEERHYGHKLPQNISIYSELRARRAETFIITLVFCLLVLGPVAALSYLNESWQKLVIIAVAIVFTSAVASGLSDTAHKGSLAVIAGYTAILAVFLGNSIQK